MTVHEAIDETVLDRADYETVRKRVQRAGVPVRGREGKHNLYARADLYAMQQREKVLVK